MSVKVGNFTHVSRTNIARGIRYAVDNGANILSMSYGFNDPSFLERDALTYAYENGVVLVAAAGNAGSNKKFYPAAYSKVIAVGGTDMNDSNMHVFVDPPDFPGMWISSNHGLWVDVSAPAVNIYTTTPTYHVFFNDYGTEMNYTCATAGTSLSCPFVAGLVALILSKNPYLTPIEVKSVICNNSDPYVSDVYIGKGRINAYQAVTKQKEIDSKFTKEINLISRLNIDNNLSLLTEITIDFLPVKLSSNPSPALFYR
jgi:thermitase